jgi:hypothetical protein
MDRRRISAIVAPHSCHYCASFHFFSFLSLPIPIIVYVSYKTTIFQINILMSIQVQFWYLFYLTTVVRTSHDRLYRSLKSNIWKGTVYTDRLISFLSVGFRFLTLQISFHFIGFCFRFISFHFSVYRYPSLYMFHIKLRFFNGRTNVAWQTL